ncbi:ATP-dependent DNA ligase [Piscicoccus intestinalis]|uniref:ATP-dependent DNA ligase n=1 Tax=Piscicoccus intestinalis TaxID=746033 RepID=UPI000838C018|nr:DNA ligase [Piscicoccus intestinalis]
MQAMLATPAPRPPTGPQWSHEVKWDGMRILADVRAGRVRLATRAEVDATARFPELTGADALATAHPDVLLDGEVVSLDGGLPSFSRLIERIHARDATARRLATARPVTYLVFDVLRLDGHDLTRMPLRTRRGLLESLELPGPRVLVPPAYPDGETLLRATRDQGLEGVVSKHLESVYDPGRRSPHWLKVPHRPTISVVIGGWRPESVRGAGLGAVLVGRPHGPAHRTSADSAAGSGGGADGEVGPLRFLGRVGSGLGAAQEARLLPRLQELARPDCPFDPAPPAADRAGTHWVHPRIVVDVRSLGTAGSDVSGASGAGGAGERLRQPSFLGVRTDLTPADLRELGDA